jgi:hypothetical protein
MIFDELGYSRAAQCQLYQQHAGRELHLRPVGPACAGHGSDHERLHLQKGVGSWY